MKANHILYRIRNIMFLLFLYACIRLLPNLKEVGIIGNIFIVIVVIFSLTMLYTFFRKDNSINNSSIQNIVNVLFYIYVFLVAQKYIESSTSLVYEIKNIYFIINYIIFIIAIIGITLSNIFLLIASNEKDKLKN